MMYQGKAESKARLFFDSLAGALIVVVCFAAMIYIFYSLGCFDNYLLQ